MAQDLYVILLSPVIVRTLGSFRIVVGGMGVVLAMVAALVATGWGMTSSI